MTVTVKPKAEITVPKSIRRMAGTKPGDRVEFSVSGRVIKIVPKVSPHELQDEQEIGDPKVREHIRKSNADYLAGRGRPANAFLSELRADAPKARKKRQRSAWCLRPLRLKNFICAMFGNPNTSLDKPIFRASSLFQQSTS